MRSHTHSIVFSRDSGRISTRSLCGDGRIGFSVSSLLSFDLPVEHAHLFPDFLGFVDRGKTHSCCFRDIRKHETCVPSRLRIYLLYRDRVFISHRIQPANASTWPCILSANFLFFRVFFLHATRTIVPVENVEDRFSAFRRNLRRFTDDVVWHACCVRPFGIVLYMTNN